MGGGRGGEREREGGRGRERERERERKRERERPPKKKGFPPNAQPVQWDSEASLEKKDNLTKSM